VYRSAVCPAHPDPMITTLRMSIAVIDRFCKTDFVSDRNPG
jgi:hypothetical protein